MPKMCAASRGSALRCAQTEDAEIVIYFERSAVPFRVPSQQVVGVRSGHGFELATSSRRRKLIVLR